MTNRISDHCKTLVAFQGEHGAFSELAARDYFCTEIDTLPLRSFDDVFQSVLRRRAHLGIIPIENSLFGSIHQNYDLLRRHSLKIVGETKLRIVHSLLAHPKVRLRDVRFVYSHPQALGQCEKFLHTLKHAEAVAIYDTAGGAKFIKETNRREAAAIASSEAARVYGLRTLRTGIESSHKNFTRFLILSRTEAPAGAHAKTSIIFLLKNIPGSLYKALSVFALRKINLHKIESRPLVGRPWEYVFYLDFQGSIRDKACRAAVNRLGSITTNMKILGSYPEGNTGKASAR